MADIYQTFIDELQADPDFPMGAVVTALPAHGVVNVRFDKTSDVDQWQLAIPISTGLADAITLVTEQHQRAINRIQALKLRDARDNQQQAAQAEYHAAMKTLTDTFKQQRVIKMAAIKARHEAKKS